MNEELKIIISAEIDKLKDELQKAQKETKGFSEKSKSSLQAFGKAAGAAGKAVAAGMKVAAGAIAAGAAALVGLAESTREYRTEQAKLSTAFVAAGGSAEQATETYNDLYRVLGDSGQAVEAAGHLAQLTTNQQDLAEWTTACQGIYATFGDSLPIESLTEAANETAKTGEITGALADALNWAGVSEDEFAEQLFWCNTEAEREKLIRTTLTDLYGDAAATYETTAASILTANEAQAALTESMAALGASAEPIVAIFKQGFKILISGFNTVPRKETIGCFQTAYVINIPPTTKEIALAIAAPSTPQPAPGITKFKEKISIVLVGKMKRKLNTTLIRLTKTPAIFYFKILTIQHLVYCSEIFSKKLILGIDFVTPLLYSYSR